MLWDEGPTLPWYDLTLTNYILSVLISKSPSEILWVRTSTYAFFGGCNSTGNTQGGTSLGLWPQRWGQQLRGLPA